MSEWQGVHDEIRHKVKSLARLNVDLSFLYEKKRTAEELLAECDKHLTWPNNV